MKCLVGGKFDFSQMMSSDVGKSVIIIELVLLGANGMLLAGMFILSNNALKTWSNIHNHNLSSGFRKSKTESTVLRFITF